MPWETKIKGSMAILTAACLSTVVGLTPALAQKTKAPPKSQVLFTNCNIFDGKSDKLARGMSVAASTGGKPVRLSEALSPDRVSGQHEA